MYNAFQTSIWSASGRGRWPYHGLDLAEWSWGWSSAFVPTPSDFAVSDLLLSLFGDFAATRGQLPASWGWQPVTPGTPISTFVVAQDGGFPGGGSRAVEGWKAQQCAVLQANRFDGKWW